MSEAVPTTRSDQRVIVGQTGQNVAGLLIGALATFGAQIVMSQRLGPEAFGIVVATSQFAFIAAAFTRFGMDVANVRLVSILAGRGEGGRSPALVRRSVAIAVAVSVPFAAAVFVAAPWLAERFSGLPAAAEPAFRWAAVAIPVTALAFTYLGATRGLKIMVYTLAGQWIGQPVGWIVLTVAFWAIVAATAGSATAAFAASWGVALAIGAAGWTRERRRLPDPAGEGIPEEHTGALLRFGALRAPATLFSQLLFFTDFYVISLMYAGQAVAGASAVGAAAVGVYGAVLRASQALFLFLASVSLTFSPFVADLHHRGERDRLNRLYQQVTRWALTATIPVLLVLLVLPEQVLRLFGPGFGAGATALRIVAAGMIVPVIVGTVGFILIMAGRTGWDLLVYVAAFAIDVAVALSLAQPDVLGIRGAAIAQACTLTFSAIARLLLVRRFLGIWPFDGWYLRLVPASAAGAAAMWLVHEAVPQAQWLVNLLVASVAGVAAYGVVVFAFSLPLNERAMAGKLARRFTGRGGGA
jgi:O-antigen/teichoic acid export membrane protein